MCDANNDSVVDAEDNGAQITMNGSVCECVMPPTFCVQTYSCPLGETWDADKCQCQPNSCTNFDADYMLDIIVDQASYEV